VPNALDLGGVVCGIVGVLDACSPGAVVVAIWARTATASRR
jgi:hypothetical protein